MFRVKLNLWSNSPQTKSEPIEASVERRDDWADEQQRVDARLTREDLCKTFQDKFAANHDAQAKNIA